MSRPVTDSDLALFVNVMVPDGLQFDGPINKTFIARMREILVEAADDIEILPGGEPEIHIADVRAAIARGDADKFIVAKLGMA